MYRRCQNNCAVPVAMSHFIILIIVLCLSHLSTQRSTSEDDHYVAAVVEYRVLNDVPTNLQNYVNLIKDASTQNADIIVFPELTLSRGRSVVIPIDGILKDYPVPALRPDLYDEVLVTVSSAARQNAIYVVINIEELVDCTKDTSEYCPEQKVYLFNTNVVFDRIGAVIDRYRKINLFGEYTRTPALKPDLGIFTTDFGVTFGHFICFDLMFQVPAVQLVDKYNLTDIIFPTMWFSEMPYLTAVQIQEAYAYSMNVNFLGAGANNVQIGSAGSGIYSGKAGALISTMPGTPTTRLLVAKVPKIPGQISDAYPGPIYDDPSDHDNLYLIADPSLPSHISQLLTPGFQEITLTDKDVTCHFKVRLEQRNNETSYYYRAFIQDGTTAYSRRLIGVAACLIVACKSNDIKSCPYRYRVAAFSGVRSFSGVATGGSRLCSVIACSSDGIDSCSRRFPSFVPNATAEFEELEIIAEVPTPVIDEDIETSNSAYFPVSLDTSIMPLEYSDYTFEETNANGRTIYKLTLNNFDSELYAFSIWGRVYGTDGEEASPPVEVDNSPGAGAIHNVESILLFISLSIYVLINV